MVTVGYVQYVQNARFGNGHRQSRGKEDLQVGLPGGTRWFFAGSDRNEYNVLKMTPSLREVRLVNS